MTREELAAYDGREGRRAYVAVGGTIYDFTGSPLWRDGDHKGVHRAGADLTEELKRAPHVRMVVERFPVVGVLEETVPAAAVAKSRTALVAAGVIALLLLALFLLR